MSKINILALALITTMIHCNTKGQSLLKDVFDDAKMKVKFDVLTKNSYADSTQAKDFDFNAFLPIKDIAGVNSSCIIYYDKGVVAHIKLKKAGNTFLFNFYPSQDFIYYTVFVDDGKTMGGFAKGIFIHDKKQKTNTFFGLVHNAWDIPLEQKKRQAIKLKPSTSISSISTILALDNELFSKTRLNWFDNELLSFSYVKNDRGTVYEEMSIYAKQSCEGQVSLDKIDLGDLYYLLNGRACSEGLIFKVLPNYENSSIPYWMNIDRGYLVK